MKGRNPNKPELKHFIVSSGYGSNTRRPFVEIVAPELRTTMNSAEARALALNILEGAITAEADGLIVEFFTKELGTTQEQAAVMLMKFREYRKRWRDEVNMA
jgi:hypothetical protein